VNKRGRHKVFLGMAAGVGKTYRMLQEGRELLAGGADVCVGLLETHGREDTRMQSEGLELLPRRRIVYRDSTLWEMDLPGILARAPQVCLIDELAHTNVPGVERHKRYEDVYDVLGAGIDVLSTVNVQHLESLNDQVADLTGVRVRETVPDRVLAEADEVVIIDITPETLIGRLQAGKVYPAERVEAALNNFFKIENLASLREVALRQIAEEVAPKRLEVEPAFGTRHEDRVAGTDAQRAVRERLLALVQPRPSAQRLIRRAFRSAQRLGAALDILWVKPPGHRATPDEERQLSNLRQLASLLGAELRVEEDNDIAAATARFARQQGTTYVLVGQAKPRGGARRLAEPFPQRLMRLAPGVDVRIVADRIQREPTEDAP
jgi:two-component system sensor histidine kinase KdpD